jgi:hypothetical protein
MVMQAEAILAQGRGVRFHLQTKRGQDTDTMPTLGDVIGMERDWDRAHTPVDQTVSLQQFMYTASKDVSSLVKLGTGSSAGYDLNEHAHNQLLSKMDYGQRLYSRSSDRMNVLHVNELIQNEKQHNVMLRLQDYNTVRAVLGAGYANFDTLEFLEMVQPFMEGGRVRMAYDDNMTFHLVISFPVRRVAVRVGDIVEMGFHFRNSPVGISSVTMGGLLYRLRCTNGLVSADRASGLFRFRHTGDRAKLQNAVRQAIEQSTTDTYGLMENFKHSVDVAVADPASRLEAIAKDNNLSQADFKDFINHMMEEPDPTLFGVVNAISATARDRQGEEQYNLSRIATRVLTHV